MLMVEKTNDEVVLLKGSLALDDLLQADKLLPPLVKTARQIDGSALEKMDTAGALFLLDLARSHEGRTFIGFSKDQMSLLSLVGKASEVPVPVPEHVNYFLGVLEHLGRFSINFMRLLESMMAFFGQIIVSIPKNIKHFRMDSLARHIQETGLDAIPIVALVAFLISLVLAYQGASQLRPLGAETFTVNLVAISVLREMGVLLTAIMVAGRSGSAFTAEIGVMKVTEEVDALSMIGIEPFDILVFPRLFALFITLPLLTFIADMVGLAGGSVTCAMTLDISWQQYWEQVRLAVHATDFWVGMIKAPVFALIIALVGCKLGMQVSGSAESVGTTTTRSVVESIFMVLVADAFFSIMFSKIGW